MNGLHNMRQARNDGGRERGCPAGTRHGMATAALIACGLAVGALLAGCGAPKAEVKDTPAASAAAPVPNPTLQQTHADCQWGEVRAAGISMWRFTCANTDIVADETLPGFVRESVFEDGTRFRSPVVQIFQKPADAPIEAILPALRAASPGDETSGCVLEAAPEGGFSFVPSGEGRARYQKFLDGSADGPAVPCGIWGPSEVGSRAILTIPGVDDRVAAVEFGSDPPLHDYRTLKAAPQ